MKVPRPELIFVAGPQQGERCLLASNNVVVGRSPNCDVHAVEDTVSREQMRMDLTADGWVVENVSRNAIRINDTKFKRAKRILVETGDVIGIGIETRILFVATGDDPEIALRAFREANGPPEAQPEPTLPEPPAEDRDQPAPDTTAVEPASTGAPATALVDEHDRQRRAKIRKYIIGFGVYATALVALIVFLGTRSDDEGKVTSSGRSLRKLTDKEIEDTIVAPTDAPRYPTEAADALRKALRYYEHELDQQGDLYRAVKYFKLHLAFKGSPDFDQIKHHAIFLKAQDKLIEQAKTTYSAAWVYENNRQWRAALEKYEQLLRMLPVTEDPYPEPNNAVFRNVLEHERFVRKHLEKRRR